MTPQEKYNAVIDAYGLMTRDNGEDIHIIKETTPEEVQTALLRMQRENGATFDISYEIGNDATNIIADCTMEQLLDKDYEFYEEEAASVYTSTRLGYLNNNNQAEISDLVHEYGGDISQACAIWYDKQVQEMCEALRTYIITE